MVLPFDVERQPAARPPTPTGRDLVAAARQVRQRIDAPQVRPARAVVPDARPDRTGQYALPLEGLVRTPRPRPVPPPPTPRPGARPAPQSPPVAPRHRQLLLPHMPRRTRPPRPEGETQS